MFHSPYCWDIPCKIAYCGPWKIRVTLERCCQNLGAEAIAEKRPPNGRPCQTASHWALCVPLFHVFFCGFHNYHSCPFPFGWLIPSSPFPSGKLTKKCKVILFYGPKKIFLVIPFDNTFIEHGHRSNIAPTIIPVSSVAIESVGYSLKFRFLKMAIDYINQWLTIISHC